MKKNKSKKLLLKPISFILFFFYNQVQAQTELDLSFIQGKNTSIPDILNQSTGNIPGDYIVDVFFNNKKITKKNLKIDSNDVKHICLSIDWLKSLDIPINYDNLEKNLKSSNKCLYLNKIPGGNVIFDYSQQSLKISLPQTMLNNNHSDNKWDYGTSGFLLNYSINANKNYSHDNLGRSENLYANIDFNANYGKWVFSTNFAGSSNEGVSSPDITLSTAVKSLRGDFIIGKSITQSSIIPDFSFVGVSLRSNSSMTSWMNRGYAPVIQGNLNSNSLVTVKQGDYILFNKNLPAGPYLLDNLAPISNGDLSVITTDINGKKSVRIYPVTTLPSLLRENDFNYNFVTGIKTDSNQSDENIFGLLSIDYGFGFGTTNFAAIVHPDYQSLGSGLTLPLGEFGAISTSLNYAVSHYDSASYQLSNKRRQQGLSAVLQYAKDFGENTNLQLLSYRYTGKGYNDFSNFDSHDIHIDAEKKNRFEAIVSQRINNAYLNASGWIQSYRGGKKDDSGLNLSLSTAINDISLGINGSYDYSESLGDNYSASLNITIPVNLWQKTQFINNGFNYDSINGSSYNSGLSFTPDNRVTNTVNLNVGKDQKTASIYTGIQFDDINTGFSISQNNNITALSAHASGSLVGAENTGFILSSQHLNTVAVAHIDDIDNVMFNGSSYTNKDGNALISLTSYQPNSIVMNTNNISENIELLDTNYDVYPTSKAILVKNFKYLKVNRYLLKVVDKDGHSLPMGSQALSDKNIDVGMITNNGILVASLLSKSKFIAVRNGEKLCKINLSLVTANTNKISNVSCL